MAASINVSAEARCEREERDRLKRLVSQAAENVKRAVEREQTTVGFLLDAPHEAARGAWDVGLDESKERFAQYRRVVRQTIKHLGLPGGGEAR